MKSVDYTLASANAKEVAWLLEAIVSRSPIGVAVIDLEGCYRQVNPAYCELYGYTEAELLGHSFTMVFPEEARQLTLKRHQRFLLEGTELRGEFRVRRRDGADLTIISESVRVPGDGGQPLRLVYVVDITERRRGEDELRRSEETFRTLFETVPQGVVYHRLDGSIRTANPAAERILGLKLEQLQGRLPIDPRWGVIYEDGTHFPGAQHPVAVTLRTGEPVCNTIMGVQVPGRGIAWINVSTIPVRRDGVMVEVYACFEDVTDRQLLSRELAYRASTDFLTGLANRRSMNERLLLEWERIRRHAERPCSVLSIDIDHFKRVNDSHGHAIGDSVLQGVASVMAGLVRASDSLCRTGGEEFTVLLPDTDLAQATMLAERLRAAVAAKPISTPVGALGVSVSIGVSAIASADPGADAVLTRADAALYDAKRAGRNCLSVRTIGAG